MKFIFTFIIALYCITMQGQIIDDSIHSMLYYEIMIKMKNCHPMCLQGISDDVVLFNKQNKDLQSFADSFYAQADYCLDPTMGVSHLPSTIIGDNNRDEMIIKYGNFKKIHPSQKIKLKECTLYVAKYLIKGRRLISNDFYNNSVEATWLLSNYHKNKYLLFDVEPLKQLKIDNKEFLKRRIQYERWPIEQDSTARRSTFFTMIESALYDNEYTKNLSKVDVEKFEKENFLILTEKSFRSDTLVMYVQSIGCGDYRKKRCKYFVLKGHKFFIDGTFPKALSRSIQIKRNGENFPERDKVVGMSDVGCNVAPGIYLKILYDLKKQEVVDVTDNSISDIYYVAEENPEFRGGGQALSLYLQQKIAFHGLEKDEGGIVQFIVEKDGTLSNISVVKFVGKTNEDILMDIIRDMPPWVPAKQHGIPCRMVYYLPIGMTK